MSVNVFKQCVPQIEKSHVWTIVLIALVVVIVGAVELASDWDLATDFARWAGHLFNIK